VLLKFRDLRFRFRESRGKYFFKGRKRTVDKFTTRQGLGIIAAIVAILAGLLLLWMLGYLHFDVDQFSFSLACAEDRNIVDQIFHFRPLPTC